MSNNRMWQNILDWYYAAAEAFLNRWLGRRPDKAREQSRYRREPSE